MVYSGLAVHLSTFCLNWSGGNVIIPISPSGIIAAPWEIRKS